MNDATAATPDGPELDPDLTHHGGEGGDSPVEGPEMAGRRRSYAPIFTRVRESTEYSWDELVDLAKQGYEPETNWRFEHLSPEQRHTIARQAARAAAA